MDELRTPAIALVVGVLLAAGAAAAAAVTRAAARRIPRSAALMAAVTAWLVLFGLVPLTAFAFLVPGPGERPADPPTGWEVVVLNVVPFTLLASPLIGFVQGMRATRPPRSPSA